MENSELTGQSFTKSNLIDLTTNAKFYNSLNQPWNTRLFPTSTPPLAYFLPTSTIHVVAAVLCGQENKKDIKLIPNSGGHSYEGISWQYNNSTVIVDFRRMQKVEVGFMGTTKVKDMKNLQRCFYFYFTSNV